MGQSERQIGFSSFIILALALPALFVKPEIAAGLAGALVIIGFVLSFLFKEFVIDLLLALAGLVLAVNFFTEFSRTENELDFLAGCISLLVIIAIAASVAISHSMEGRLKMEFAGEFYENQGSLSPEIASKFGLKYTDPVSSFSGVEVEER